MRTLAPAGVVLAVAVLAACRGGGSTVPPAGVASYASVAASAVTAPHTATARIVATFTGSGDENTARFTVTDTWKLAYSFNCSSFGYAANFIVLEDGSYGALSVNDLAMSKTATSWAYDDAGTHYLKIGSECAWKVRVIDEG